MQAREWGRLDQRLEGFLSKLTAGLGRAERRRWAGVYVRGLLLDGARKGAEPMAARLGQSDQALQQLVSQSLWSADVLLEGLVSGETYVRLRLGGRRVLPWAARLAASFATRP